MSHAILSLFVPGRLCLFGEHSDWAGGYRRTHPQIPVGRTLICGTDQGLYATVEPHPDHLILSSTTPEGQQLGPYSLPMQAEALRSEAQSGSFWSYAAGAAYQMLLHYPVGGLILRNERTDLPIGKGLSSSAAICVLTVRAFNRLYNLGLDIRQEMELAYQGEICTPSRCGRMDQGCAFGNRVVLMTFDGDALYTEEIHPGGEICLVVADLKQRKDTRKILERLNRCYPVASDEIARGVQHLLGPLNLQVLAQAVAAVQDGDARRLGALMTEAQALFDRYALPACPEELTAPALHRALRHPALKPHIWGGKGVGSQGDGSVQFVARSPDDQKALIALLARELGLTGLGITLRPPQDTPDFFS